MGWFGKIYIVIANNTHPSNFFIFTIHGPGLGIIFIEKIPIANKGTHIPRLREKSEVPPRIKSLDFPI